MAKMGRVQAKPHQRRAVQEATMMKMKMSLNRNQLPVRKVTPMTGSTVGHRMTVRISERVTLMG